MQSRFYLFSIFQPINYTNCRNYYQFALFSLLANPDLVRSGLWSGDSG